MTRCVTMMLALAALVGASSFAQARPPTVMSSPGYDARLKESRSALGGTATTPPPVAAPAPAPKHKKKKQAN